MIGKGLLDILHIGTTTSQDDTTQQLVVILRRKLIPYILDNLFKSSLNDLYKLTTFNLTIGVNRVFQVVINLAIIGVGTAVFQFHLFCIAFLNLERCNILGDIVTAKRNNGKMAQDVLRVDGNSGGVGSEIHQCTARAAFCFCQDAVGQS